MEYQRRNEDFARLERWVETRGAKVIRQYSGLLALLGKNQNPVPTLSNNLMNADAAFDVIMGRSAKEKAMRDC